MSEDDEEDAGEEADATEEGYVSEMEVDEE